MGSYKFQPTNQCEATSSWGIKKPNTCRKLFFRLVNIFNCLGYDWTVNYEWKVSWHDPAQDVGRCWHIAKKKKIHQTSNSSYIEIYKACFSFYHKRRSIQVNIKENPTKNFKKHDFYCRSSSYYHCSFLIEIFCWCITVPLL